MDFFYYFFLFFFEKNRKETLKPQKSQLFPALWVPLFSGESQPGILLALTWATRSQCLHPRVSPRAPCPSVLQDRDTEWPHTHPTAACGLPAAGSVPAQRSVLQQLTLHPTLLLRCSVE